MELMIRTNEQGFKDYYDWDMEDNETVIVHVNEVTKNRQGNWFIKADYNGAKFYANISPEDGNYLRAGNKYRMTCTGHNGKFKYLNFEKVIEKQVLDESQIAMMFGAEPQNINEDVEPEHELNQMDHQSGNVQTVLPTSNTSDQECTDYLYKHKKDLETKKYRIDKELGVINKLIMKTC